MLLRASIVDAVSSRTRGQRERARHTQGQGQRTVACSSWGAILGSGSSERRVFLGSVAQEMAEREARLTMLKHAMHAGP